MSNLVNMFKQSSTLIFRVLIRDDINIDGSMTKLLSWQTLPRPAAPRPPFLATSSRRGEGEMTSCEAPSYRLHKPQLCCHAATNSCCCWQVEPATNFRTPRRFVDSSAADQLLLLQLTSGNNQDEEWGPDPINSCSRGAAAKYPLKNSSRFQIKLKSPFKAFDQAVLWQLGGLLRAACREWRKMVKF